MCFACVLCLCALPDAIILADVLIQILTLLLKLIYTTPNAFFQKTKILPSLYFPPLSPGTITIFLIFLVFKCSILLFLLPVTIHEIALLLLPLSTKPFLLNLPHFIPSLNNRSFQPYVQIFNPYSKFLLLHVICILRAWPRQITSPASISAIKSPVFPYCPKSSYLLI